MVQLILFQKIDLNNKILNENQSFHSNGCVYVCYNDKWKETSFKTSTTKVALYPFHFWGDEAIGRLIADE